MSESLLKTKQTFLDVEPFLTRVSDGPPAEIVKPSADSRAWIASSGGQAYFLKWVEAARYEVRLARDVAICSRSLHPAIPRLLNVVRTADGMLLVLEHAAGETLSDRRHRERFFALRLATKLVALRAIFGALAAIADVGWVLVDFYEGNVLYDFATHTVKVFDFELCEPGCGFVLQLDRNCGSSRLMAPEEFVRGAWIDATSNVFTLGRYAIHGLSARRDEQWRTGFEGSSRLADVITRATRPERAERYPTVRAFVEAFERAASA